MRIGAISWGVFFVGLGVLVFGVNFGYLDSYVWIRLFSLWPIGVIAIGIGLIFGHTRLKFLGLLAPLLIALTFVYVGVSEWGYNEHHTYYHSSSDYRYNREVFKYTLADNPDVKELYVNMDIGNGELWIGSTSREMFDGDFEYRRRKPRCDYEVVGDEGRLTVKSRDDRWFGFFPGKRYKNDARVYIGDFLPLDLKLDLGAADINLDLAEHMLRKLRIRSGASRLDLRLGCKSDSLNVDIQAGASDVTITVPRDMALAIDSDGALSSNNFKDIGLEKVNGKWQSPDFATATCFGYFDIDSGVSEIRIKYY